MNLGKIKKAANDFMDADNQQLCNCEFYPHAAACTWWNTRVEFLKNLTHSDVLAMIEVIEASINILDSRNQPAFHANINICTEALNKLEKL